MSKASDLIFEYVLAEKNLVEAEKIKLEMVGKKRSLLQEIKDNAPLKNALMTTGVIQSGKLCRLDHISSGGQEMTVYDEPISSYSLQDEPEVMESGDE